MPSHTHKHSLSASKYKTMYFCLRITFCQIWTDLFESDVCLKYCVVYMYAHERNLILMFLHTCRNYETALISCLIMLKIFLFVVVSCLFVFVVQQGLALVR